MKLKFNRYNQKFIALIPFLNVWYDDNGMPEVLNIGWLKWTASVFMEKVNG